MIYHKLWLICLIIIFTTGISLPQGNQVIFLPEPNINSNNDFLNLLRKRKSVRNFTAGEINAKQLSEILWAAYGITDENSGKRTVPSAYAIYEISIYVLKEDGVFLYIPENHSLKRIRRSDLRKYAGLQGYVAAAPLNLVYVADFKKMGSGSAELSEAKKYFLAAANTGFIAQNIYLYCASAGLGTVVRDWINRDLLAEKLGIKDTDMKIILGQTIGYPAEK